MKIFIDKITNLRSECEKLEKEGYKTKGREYEGRDVSKIVFEKEIGSKVDRLLYGLAAFLLTAGTLFIGLASEKVRDFWDRAFSGKKITQITFPVALDRRVQKIFEKKSAPSTQNQEIKTTLQEVVDNFRTQGNRFANVLHQKVTDEEAALIGQLITRTQNITSLLLAHNQISNQGLKSILKPLENNTVISDLDLYGETLGDEAANEITAILKSNHTIDSLSFHAGNVSAESLRALIKALKESTAITSFSLKVDQFPEELVDLLAETLKTNLHLTSFSLKAAILTPESHKKLLQAVDKHPNLKSFDFPVPKRTQETLEQLKINIESDSKTDSLSLEGGELKALAPSIAKNTHITTLSLTNSTQEDLEALSELLNKNTFIRSLTFLESTLGDTGTSILAQALMGNDTITSLYLAKTQTNGEVLATALTKNKTLKSLILDENSLGDKGGIALFKALSHHPTLGYIALKQTGIGDATIQAMIESGFLAKTKARLVELDDNQISDVGAIALAKEANLLRQTPALEKRRLRLDLENNPIGDEGALAIDLIERGFEVDNDVLVKFD